MAIGIEGAAVDAGGGAAEKSIMLYMKLVYLQSLLQGWLSGRVLRVITAIGEGIVDKSVGATGREISQENARVYVSVCERGPFIQ